MTQGAYKSKEKTQNSRNSKFENANTGFVALKIMGNLVSCSFTIKGNKVFIYFIVGDMVPCPPLPPLSLILLHQIGSSARVRAKALSPTHFVLACGPILFCNLKAIGCFAHSPFRCRGGSCSSQNFPALRMLIASTTPFKGGRTPSSPLNPPPGKGHRPLQTLLITVHSINF